MASQKSFINISVPCKEIHFDFTVREYIVGGREGLNIEEGKLKCVIIFNSNRVIIISATMCCSLTLMCSVFAHIFHLPLTTTMRHALLLSPVLYWWGNWNWKRINYLLRSQNQQEAEPGIDSKATQWNDCLFSWLHLYSKGVFKNESLLVKNSSLGKSMYCYPISKNIGLEKYEYEPNPEGFCFQATIGEFALDLLWPSPFITVSMHVYPTILSSDTFIFSLLLDLRKITIINFMYHFIFNI